MRNGKSVCWMFYNDRERESQKDLLKLFANGILNSEWNLSKPESYLTLTHTTNWNYGVNTFDLFYFLWIFKKKIHNFIYAFEMADQDREREGRLCFRLRWDNCQTHYCFKMNWTLTTPMQTALADRFYTCFR